VGPTDALPPGPFAVLKISVPQGAQLPADWVKTRIVPNVASMHSLTQILRGNNGNLRCSDEELALLTQTPAAAALTDLDVGCSLNPTTLKWLELFPALTHLALYAEAADDEVLIGFAKFRGLVDLGIPGLGAKKKDGLGERARAALTSMPLERLSLNGATPLDADLARRIAGMSTLKTLWLGQMNNARREVLAELARSKTITHLRCTYMPFNDQDVEPLSRMENLQILQLYPMAITDACIEHLAKIKTLREVRLDPSITEAGARKLAEALPECLIIYGNGQRIQPKIDPKSKPADDKP
jgi:hypothetical protein